MKPQTVHLFSEVDMDMAKPAEQIRDELWNACEELGFFQTDESYGFSIQGPFNVQDELEVTLRFKVEKVNGVFMVTKVKYFAVKEGTSKLAAAGVIYDVNSNEVEASVL